MNSRKYFILILEVGVAMVGVWLTFKGLTGEAAYVAGFCTLIYVVITAKLEIHFSQEDHFFSKFNMLNSLKNTEFDSKMIKTLNSYNSIENGILGNIAKKNWDDFSTQVSSLDNNKKSHLLSTDAYINYIESLIQEAKRGQKIIAVSLFLPGEFVENNFEINFNNAQKKAINKGVKLERIFVCSSSRMLDLKSTQFWCDHVKIFKSQFADEMDISSSGVNISEGFIMVDGAVFVDSSDVKGNLGGSVSTNPLDIQKANQDYLSVSRHARPLADCFPEDTKNC